MDQPQRATERHEMNSGLSPPPRNPKYEYAGNGVRHHLQGGAAIERSGSAVGLEQRRGHPSRGPGPARRRVGNRPRRACPTDRARYRVTRDPARMLPAVDNRTVEIRQGHRVAYTRAIPMIGHPSRALTNPDWCDSNI
jgi:hypothetical protein